MAQAILARRQQYPSWGPRKIKQVLESELGHPFPSISTIGLVLRRNGLVAQRPQRRLFVSRPTGLRQGESANEVWCADYKGQFRLGDKSYCYPLTITDQHSRFLLACEGMGAISEDQARQVFEEVFRERGLPIVVRTDNGVPFATTGLAGLSKLTVYWMLLGIEHERIRPAHPEENGRHERMHRTLKFETTRPARDNLLQQPSPRPYPTTIAEPSYPLHDDTLYVSVHGNIRVPGCKTLYLSTALAHQPVGIREEPDGRWLISFINLPLAYVENRRIVPFAPPPRGT
jgi:putative transposase